MEHAKFLKLQHHAQPLIHRSLQSRRQRAGVFGQKAPIEGQSLTDVHDRIAGQPRQARRQQDVAGGFGEVQVGRNDRDDCGLNPVEIEGIPLNHKRRLAVARFLTPGSGISARQISPR